MKVYQGQSHHMELQAILEDLLRDFPEQDASAQPDVILVFASTAQPSDELMRALASRYAECVLVGCTTSGEHITGSHHNGSVVITGLHTPQIQWASCLLDDVVTCEADEVSSCVSGLFEKLDVHPDRNFPLNELFGVLFIDGLSMSEERVTAMCSDALEGVQLVGGSAGDDLKFESTRVFHRGEVKSGAAVLLLARSHMPFRVLKHQHFYTTPERLAITRADVDRRLVYEMDGYPAAQAYARALGITRAELNSDTSFLHPLSFQSNGELYMRSVQSINEDDSLTFYCAIEEGMVLNVSNSYDMDEAMSKAFEGFEAKFVLGFHCILRSLEAKKASLHDDLASTFGAHSATSIGFDTYGEQLNGLHINQTLLALALGCAA